MKYLLSLVLLLVSLDIFAQKEKIEVVRSIRGEFSVVLEFADVTGREAMQLARDDAKKKALEAVCGSRMNIWDQIETSSAGDAFNSLSINQIDGEIVEFDIKEEGTMQSTVRQSETIFFCVADVKVKRGLDPDPEFYATVNGLKSVYYSGENLTFEVYPYKDSYMKIFLLEDEQIGYMLYPGTVDQPHRLESQKVFNIADTPYYQIELYKSGDKDIEINRLVFVFTKKDVPFNQYETSRSEIEKWMAMIPNDQKYMHFAIIEIRDK